MIYVWCFYYHNEAEGLSNLDDLLMQFKDPIDSMQQAFKRAETQIYKLVDDMTKVLVRREEEYAEIETHQESILQVNTIHHQPITKEEKEEDKYKKNFSKKRLNSTICPKEFFKEKSFTRVFTLW